MHYKIVSLLVLVVIGIMFQDSFAQTEFSGILADIDYNQYQTGDQLILTGAVLESMYPTISVSILSPSGVEINSDTLSIDDIGLFSEVYFLESPTFSKEGKYTILLEYGDSSEKITFEIKNQSTSKTPSDTTSNSPGKILQLFTEKKVYHDNEFVTIKGVVSSYDPLSDSSTLLIGIYDPDSQPTGFYFGEIDSNLDFTIEFLAEAGINFKKDGTYSIQAHYGDSFEIAYFDYKIQNKSKEVKENEPTKSPIKDTSTKPVSPKTENTNPENDAEKSTPKTNPNKPKYDNLSVEDIELGTLLNQNNLACDKSKFSDEISYYDGMGPALLRLCKYDQALSFFNQDLIKNPNNYQALVNKGVTLSKMGRYSEAIEYYDIVLSNNPSFVSALNNKANALANIGKPYEAIEFYQKVLEINPNYIISKINLAKVSSEIKPLQIAKVDVTPSQEKPVPVSVKDPEPPIPSSVHPSDGNSISEGLNSLISFLKSGLLGIFDS